MVWIERAVGCFSKLARSSVNGPVNHSRTGLTWRCKVLAAAWLLGLCTGLQAQSPEPPSQLPKTPPNTASILSTYEGQNVTSIEIAGRPGLDTSKLTPLFQQKTGEPFSKQKVDETIAALKSAGKFTEVQLQVEPEANGVRILMVAEPAIWFGIFEFPGAERFPYSKLVQIANYPPQAPYNPGDVQKDSDALASLLSAGRLFRSRGSSPANPGHGPQRRQCTVHGEPQSQGEIWNRGHRQHHAGTGRQNEQEPARH